MNSLINYTETENALNISLNSEGLEEIADIIDKASDYTTIWLDITEYERCNGEFEFILPEKIGALTDAPIIGFGTYWDDNGEVEETEETRYYWLENYAVFDEMEALRNGETITLIKAS
jgi:hypothetical protein